MPAEFNWWLLVVGLVIGAGAVWLILVELGLHEDEVTEAEIADESLRIADELRAQGEPIDADAVAAVLRLHREHLRRPLPDEGEDDDLVAGAGAAGGTGRA